MDRKALKPTPSAATAAPAKALPGVVTSKPVPFRPFANRARTKRKDDFFTRLRGSTGFIMCMGILSIGVGIISYIPFHNQFSKLMLDLGLVTFFFALFIKLVEIGVRIVTER